MFKKIVRIVLICLGLLVILVIILAMLAEPAEPKAYFQDLTRPAVIAHQGGDGLWPGDTRFAFEKAAELGVDVLEMDIHSSLDGVLVTMHDESVDRTTDGSGLIKEMTFSELRALDAGYDWTPDDGDSYPFRGQGIQVASLEELFQAFPGMRMNIEIKQAEPPIAEPLCTLLREYQMTDHVLIASFNQAAVEEFRVICPEVATSGGETEIRNFFILSLAYLGRLFSPEFQAVQVPEYRSGLHVLTPKFVRAAHQRGLWVDAWTINTPEEMQHMLELGVDGIITDYPDRLLELVNR